MISLVLLNADEVAKIIGVAKSTVYGLAREKKIPSVSISKKIVRFRLEDLENLFSTGDWEGSEQDFLDI